MVLFKTRIAMLKTPASPLTTGLILIGIILAILIPPAWQRAFTLD